MIHQNAESLKEIYIKYDNLIKRRDDLTMELSKLNYGNKNFLEVKKDLDNLNTQIEKIKIILLEILVKIQQNIDELQIKNAPKLS